MAPKLVDLADRLREVGVDRVELLNGREMGRFTLSDQRAFGYQGAPDAAADRRTHGGVFQVQPGALHVGLSGRDVGFRLTEVGDGRLVLDLGGDLAGDQLLDALGLLCRLLEHGLSFCQGRFARLQFHFERRGIDAIEHVARFHLAALLEGPLHHDAGHARPYFGDAGRRDTARKLTDEWPGGRLHRDDADLDRHLDRRRRLGFAARCEQRGAGTHSKARRKADSISSPVVV